MPCSNTAKAWKPLKVAGVPQTPETISDASGPKFTIFALSMVDIQSPTAEIRRGNKERRKKQDENIMVCPIP